MSLGNDLATIRNELGFSLEEIQSQIKIPTHTLKTIENDSIFDDPEQSQTYTRSFVRSYAKALKIPDEIIVKALDSVEAKIYNPGDLLRDLDLNPPTPLFKPEALEKEQDDSDSVEEEPPQEPVAPKTESKVEEPPTVENVNWADLGRKFEVTDSPPKVWVAFAIAILVITLIVLGIIFRSTIFEFFTSSDTDPTEIEQTISNLPPPLIATNPVDTTSTETIDTPDSSTPINSSGNPYFTPQNSLGDTVTVSIYAAFDKLEPVRVTSDVNWRTNPFWMEPGEAFNFDFVDTLLIRGQYSRMLLLFNGHVIDEPANRFFNVDFNSVMLTRDVLDSPEYLSTPPGEFPYEIGLPDSLVYRIDF